MSTTLLRRIFAMTATRPGEFVIRRLTLQGLVGGLRILVAQWYWMGSPAHNKRELFGAYGRDHREGLGSVGQFPHPRRMRSLHRTSSQGRYRAMTAWSERRAFRYSVNSTSRAAHHGEGGAGLTAGGRACKPVTAEGERETGSGGNIRREAAFRFHVSSRAPEDSEL